MSYAHSKVALCQVQKTQDSGYREGCTSYGMCGLFMYEKLLRQAG